MGFYDQMATTARRLLTSRGQTAVLLQQFGGDFDPLSQESRFDEASTGCRAAILPLSSRDIAFWGGDSKVIDRNEQALVSVEPFPRDPLPGDLLSVGRLTYTIHGVRLLAPAGTPVLWTFLVGA